MAAADTTNSPVHWVEKRIASGTTDATPNVTGSRATDAWRTSLMAALVAAGIVTDGSSA